MAIKAQPKSVGGMFPERYLGAYNNTAVITEVSVVQSKNKPENNGCLAIHLKGQIFNQSGKAEEVHMIDWYGKKKPATATETFAQQMLNRATAAQLSAGVAMYDKEIEPKEARKIVKEIFEGLIGKRVTISQYYKEGYSLPNIQYKFVEDGEATEASSDDDDDDELPL